MSESRNNGESRGYPSYPRDYSVYKQVNLPESTIMGGPNYNSLDSIDELIERLEREIPKDKSISSKVNDAYASRRKKLAELKKLQQQAKQEQERQRKMAEEEKKLSEIQQGNAELDAAISQIKQIVKKPNPPSVTRGYTCWDDGESHNGESRW